MIRMTRGVGEHVYCTYIRGRLTDCNLVKATHCTQCNCTGKVHVYMYVIIKLESTIHIHVHIHVHITYTSVHVHVSDHAIF